jgi:hypothetical protein
MVEDIEAELQAIKTLQETLQPLKPEVRTRVLDYVFRVLGISASPPAPPPLQSPVPPELATLPHQPVPPKSRLDGPTDILTLKEQKNPSTATQMIAVVAYYLTHVAAEDERQDFITADDIQKYFVQGQYPMPGSQASALVNAKNAGYLDSVEKGKYRLNSVGYNLVAHKMPKDGSSSPKPPGSARRRKTPKKPVKNPVKKVKR